MSPPTGSEAGGPEARGRRQKLGLLLGPTLFLVAVLVPVAGTPPSAQRMGAIALWMAVWWVSEAVPLGATSLLPLALVPSLGIAPASQAAAPYAHHLIFLFLGGFLLAQAMQRWNLHTRLALHVVRFVGTSPSRIILGFMTASAGLSMWVSNTATAAMMMPIGLAVVQQVANAAERARIDIDTRPGHFNFGIALMLGIAYAASIGGTGTLIGTPPNVLLAGTLEDSYGISLSFVGWLAVGLPFVVILVPVAWLTLTRFVFPLELSEVPGGRGLIEERLGELGPMSSAERRTAAVFAATALAWVFRPIWASWLPSGAFITDSTVAMASAVLLFALPTGDGEQLLNWPWAARLPWEVLLLFGGGFSLAAGFEASGLSRYLGAQLVAFQDAPLPLFVSMIVVAIIMLTEFASNTASTAMALPILGAAATAIGASPLVLTVPATLAASCAFMLPAATPPNAIVFGTGYLTIPQMVRAGIWMNLLAALLITLLSLTWIPFVLR